MRQIPLALLAPPAHSFDNFLPGANAEALAYLLGLMPADPPVLLWGPTGSGKTHLLQALAERWQAAGQRVAWYDADTALPWELPAHESDAAWLRETKTQFDRMKTRYKPEDPYWPTMIAPYFYPDIDAMLAKIEKNGNKP